GGIAYLFNKAGDFSVLSGFSDRPEEEKEYLQKSGYLKALAILFKYSFWLLLITFIAGLLPIPYAFEIGLAIFILYLMIGLVRVQKFEVPKKRKKMAWIMGSIAVVTVLFIGGVTITGYADNEVIVTEDTLTISGMYGEEWDRSQISEVQMMDELPEVLARTNGFAMTGRLKGKFNLDTPYGSNLLFIKDKAGPFLYIQTDEQPIIINEKDPKEIKTINESLTE